ncbi:hypothetical protein GALL_115750 [mine drainage metagenome]|uniref:Uncharacterized protein n=1 Tax=mine drainage metagenome TaxID=410659 RepID=A0A1J5SD17_9ZZZZ
MNLHPDTIPAAVEFYALLAAAGAGPAMLVLGPRANRVAVAAFAPVLGLALALPLATAAVQVNLPLASCAWGLAASLALLSLACGVTARRLRAASTATAEVQPLRDYALLLALAAALLLAPAVAGGFRVLTLRGNVYDDLNYVIGAGYFEHHPLSWQSSASAAELVRSNPGFLLVKRFLWSERTPVLALLAWCARLAGRPVIDVEFAFTLTFFLVAVGPAYLLALDLGLPAAVRMLAPLTVACGFWATIVLDLRAMGQIVNLPLSLALVWLAARSLSGRATSPPRLGTALLALTLFSAGLAYPEMVPSLAWGLAGSLMLAFLLGDATRATLRTWLVALLGALLLSTTQAVFFWRLLVRQLVMSVVRGSAMSWQGDWFRFLQTPAPLAGHWGLAWGPLGSAGAWSVAATTLATLLTLALVIGLGTVASRAMRRSMTRSQASDPAFITFATLAAFASGFLAQDAAMHLVGNPWAGAKALSYGYPCLTLLVAGVFILPSPRLRALAWLRHVLGVAVLAWLTTQAAFALYHVARAPSGDTFFVYGEPQHRSAKSVGFDPEWRNFAEPLEATHGAVVWSFQPLVWESELFKASFADSADLIPLMSIDHYRTERLIDAPESESLPLPAYLLVDRSFWGDALQPGERVVIQTGRTRLIRLPTDAWSGPHLLGVLSEGSSRLSHLTHPVSLPCELWLYLPVPQTLRLEFAGSAPAIVAAKTPRTDRQLWRSRIAPGDERTVPVMRGINVLRLTTPLPAKGLQLSRIQWTDARGLNRSQRK